MHSHCVRCMPIARAAPRDRSSVTPRKWAAVINYHGNGVSILRIRHRNARSERQCAMRRCIPAGIEGLATRSSTPGGIEGSDYMLSRTSAMGSGVREEPRDASDHEPPRTTTLARAEPIQRCKAMDAMTLAPVPNRTAWIELSHEIHHY